jgi:hypothetical protein
LNQIQLAAVLVAIGLAPIAKTDTIYTYTGNDFNQVVGTYAVGGPYALDITFKTTLTGSALDSLPFTDITATVSTFSFKDGTGLVVNQNTPGVSDQIEISTNASGTPVAWLVGGYANATNTQLQTNWDSPFGFIPGADFSETTVSFAGSFGFISDNPGTWKLMTVATPEPSYATVFAGGLLGLFALRAVRGKLSRRPRNA